MAEDFPPEECPECGSLNIVYSQSRDEVICDDCGCIYARPVAITEAEKTKAKTKPKKKKAKAGKAKKQKKAASRVKKRR